MACFEILLVSLVLPVVQENYLEELKTELDSVVVAAPLDVFNGFGATVKRQRFKGEELVATFEANFDQLDKRTWRLSSKAVSDTENDITIVCSDGFEFDASKTGGDAKHQYGKSKFVSAEELRKSSNFPFPFNATRVLGSNLRQFLDSPDMVCDLLSSLPTHHGQRVTGIKFRCKKLRGEIHWLPDNAYLLKLVEVYIDLPGDDDRLLHKKEIEYTTFKDNLLPKTFRRTSKDFVEVVEATSFREANVDKGYYAAEAIGLETPSDPRKKWVWWAMAGCLFLAASLVFKKIVTK